MSLSFRVFDLELHPSCRYDALEVFAGAGTSGQRLGRFCGTFRPAPLVAPGNQVTLRMTSDEGTGGRGFLLWYSGRATSGTGETSLTSAVPLSWPRPRRRPHPSLNLHPKSLGPPLSPLPFFLTNRPFSPSSPSSLPSFPLPPPPLPGPRPGARRKWVTDPRVEWAAWGYWDGE